MFVFCGAVLASVFIVLAFRRCMTHVDSAGRPHFLCSRRLFFSSVPLLLLLSYFLLCLGRIAADCPAVENHGGGAGCDAMIFAAAQAIFWSTRVYGICSGCLFVATRFTCGNWGKNPYVLFSTCACPQG